MAKQVRGNNRNQRNQKSKTQRNTINRNKPKGGKPERRPKSKGGFKKGPSSRGSPIKMAPRGKVEDARQKIIQKKGRVTDARDVLAKKAPLQDARNKLDRMRSGRGQVVNKPSTALSPKVKVIGSSILQKVDRNGKISLVTNKSRNSTDINLTIQKQLGLIAPSRPTLKRTPPKRMIPREIAPMKKTIINELNNYPVADPYGRSYDSNLFKWFKPDLRPASHIIGSLEPARQAMRDVMREELLLARKDWSMLAPPVVSRPVRMQPREYIDLDALEEDEEMPMMQMPSRISLKGSTRTSNVHSRLDSSPSDQMTHGILSQPKTKVVVPAGHRIVVSNLQGSVTEDDIKVVARPVNIWKVGAHSFILYAAFLLVYLLPNRKIQPTKELFEDIGQLLSAKLVRPGVAEVIYKNLKDAQKAVDTYHNRQLDGQPMKCLLVNKRPVHHPTSLPMPKSEGMLGRSSSSSDVSNKLVPDISTIHKVLFQRNK